jgi:CRISPR/Cas system-associated exonuclease Cas4 (RecB family)
LEKYTTSHGPILGAVLLSLAKSIVSKIYRLLKSEAKYFNGWTILDLEKQLALQQESILLNGKIDRLIQSPDGDTIIIDYKTSVTPSQTNIKKNPESPLSDFQMPMYVRLAEQARSESYQTISAAYFYSINKHTWKNEFGKTQSGKNGMSREEYQDIMDMFDKHIEAFHTSVQGLDFRPQNVSVSECIKCTYKTVCRRTYSLKQD